MVKIMPAMDILELSTRTINNQDINIIRMLRVKIKDLISTLTSKYRYIKANEFILHILRIFVDGSALILL